MTGAFGKAELDAMGCGTPDCEHDHSVLYLHPVCHKGAGTYVAYHKDLGVLTIECVECEQPLGAIYVGERPEAAH
jgi:hypothetical protein